MNLKSVTVEENKNKRLKFDFVFNLQEVSNNMNFVHTGDMKRFSFVCQTTIMNVVTLLPNYNHLIYLYSS